MSSKIWVFWDVMLCRGKYNYKNFKDYSAFIFRVLTLKMKLLWPFETWVTSCPVTQHQAQKTCQQHHCANLKSHFRSLFHREASIFQSVWPQLESEILKAKFIFWKLHNFELNVAYMNCEGRIWIQILFWVIWLLADINKICTREIKFRSQDFDLLHNRGYNPYEYIVHHHMHDFPVVFITGWFLIWIFHCVKKLWNHGLYILYIYCDMHISH